MGRGWKGVGKVKEVIEKMRKIIQFAVETEFEEGEEPAFKESAIRELSEGVEGGERLKG